MLVATDANYAPHLAVMLNSLFTANRDSEQIVVHAIVDADDRRKALVRDACALHGRVCRLLPVPERAARFGKTRIHGANSPSPYYRISASELLPAELRRVLYLDADMIVRKSLEPLWRLDLEGAPLGASDCNSTAKDAKFMAEYNGRYFNSGVMLIDLDVWRARDIPEQASAFAAAHPERIRWWDQCVLNNVCPDWKWVDITWNFTRQLGPKHAPLIGVSEAHFRAVAADPAIIHFVGPVKPWREPAETAEGFAAEYWTARRALEAGLKLSIADLEGEAAPR